LGIKNLFLKKSFKIKAKNKKKGGRRGIKNFYLKLPPPTKRFYFFQSWGWGAKKSFGRKGVNT